MTHLCERVSRRLSLVTRHAAATSFVTAVTLATSLFVPGPSSAQSDRSGELVERSIRASRTEAAPLLDGSLDDPCWVGCAVGEDFFDMGRAAPATQATLVRVCYDDENLYVAFECLEDKMDETSAAISQRDDGNMFEVDDCVALLLDTYHDKRSCYAFAVNMAATKMDLRVAESGRSQDLGWDAVWEAASGRSDDGWTVEMAIPFSAMRFVPGESVTWGAEFLRHSAPSREQSRWVHSEVDVLDPRQFAELVGLSCSCGSRALEVTASAVGRYDAGDYRDYPLEPEDANWDLHPDAGLDAEWVPLPTLTVSGTLNPDFAQIEGDPNEINLTGDELYLEERRPFFSEGMELFQAPLTILYTRRMEDIDYGVKAGGRAGSTNLGVLYVRSEDLQRGVNAEVLTDETGSPLPVVGSDYVGVAVKQDVMESTSLGGYYAARERETSGYSRVAAATLNVPAFGEGRVLAMAARSFNSGELGDDDAFWAGLDYERAQFQFEASLERIGERFAPETGFVSADRRGRSGGAAEIGRDFMIGGERVDELELSAYGARYEGLEGGNEYWYAGSVLSTIFTNRLNFIVRGERAHNEVDYPEYPESTTGVVQLTTNLGGWSGYVVSATLGDYHNSTYYRGAVVACLQPYERLTVDARATGVALRDYEDLDWTVERLRVDWMLSRASFVRLIAQGAQVRVGVSEGDARSEQYDLNLLYGWEFSPGSMFYLAYNQTLDRRHGRDEYRDPVVVAKVSYLFNI